MRWAYEGVVFEPSRRRPLLARARPSRSAGRSSAIFGGEQPIGPMYAFVGISGMAKMSSSKGGVPTPADALQIMEPQLLRWLYARRRPNQSFKIAFDQEIQRLYDEWDTLDAQGRRRLRPARPTSPPTRRAVGTAAGELPQHPAPAAVPHARLGRRHHRRRTRSRRCASSASSTPTTRSRSLDEARPRLRPGRGLDQHARARRPAHPRARRARRRTARSRSTRPDRRVAAAAARRPRRRTGRSTASPTSSTACRRCRPGFARRRHAQTPAGDQDRPADVLRAALPPAGRPRHRPAAAHAAAGGRGRTGCGPCSAQ